MSRSSFALFGLVLVVVALGGMYFMAGLPSADSSSSSEVRLDGVTGAVVGFDIGGAGGFDPADIHVDPDVDLNGANDPLPCGAGQSWISSSHPVNLVRTGCCAHSTDCVRANGDCVVKNGLVGTNAICGSGSDWDVCGVANNVAYNKQVNDLNDDGTKRCQLSNGVYSWIAVAGGAAAAEAADVNQPVNTCDVDGVNQPMGWVDGDKTELCARAEADADPELISCDEGTQGDYYNAYACDEGKWVGCVAGHADQLVDSDKLRCKPVGQNFMWDVCPDADHHVPVANAQSFCSEGVWHVCSSDNAGDMFGNDEAQCVWVDNIQGWSTSFKVSEMSGLYELSFVKNVLPKSLWFHNTNLGIVSLTDEGTAQVSTHATLHLTLPNPRLVTVPSVSVLASEASLESLEQVNGNGIFMYQYQEGSPKKVSAILLKKFDGSHYFDVNLGAFARNLLQGRHLAFVLDGEYYLLSHPAGDLLAPSQVIVTHFPTMDTFSARVAGANWYQFEVLGNKKVAFRIDEQNRKVIFQSMDVGEQVQAYPVPYNLTARFEVGFASDSPVSLEDSGSALITVCSQDNSHDIQIMQSCVTNPRDQLVPFVTLQKDVISSFGDIGFLYQYIDVPAAEGQVASHTKQGYLFKVFLPGADSVHPLNLNYNDLITAATDGKRVALRFGGKVYLLEHQKADIFSMGSLKLVYYGEFGKQEFIASGNERRVEFTVPEGKIYIERGLNSPPPPFKVWTQTTAQLGQMDFDVGFSSSMNSLAPLLVANPGFGSVVKDVSDISRNEILFKVKLTGLPGTVLPLPYRVPVSNVQPNKPKVVFYYDAATRSGQDYVKNVKMFKFFDVGSNAGQGESFAFNDAFLDTFTSGKDLSLKFGESYYLLSYSGEEGGYFSLDNLQLNSIDGQNPFEGVSDIETVTRSFVVSEGVITVKVDDATGRISFASRTAEQVNQQDVAQLESDEIYAVSLLADTSALVAGNSYSVCDNDDTAQLENSVRVCQNGGNFELLEIQQPTIDYLNGYLVNYNGRNADGKKVVTFQKIFPFTFNSEKSYPSFARAGTRVTEGQASAYTWGDVYFELTASDPRLLSSYALRIIPGGETLPITNVKTNRLELSNGTIILGEKLLYLEQSFDAEYNIGLRLKAEPYALISAAGVNITRGVALPDGLLGYITQVGGTPFKVVPEARPNLASVLLPISVSSLDDPAIPYFYGRLANDSSVNMLLPTGESIEIHVLNSTDGKIEVR